MRKLLLLLLPLLLGGCAVNTNDQSQQSNTQTKVDSVISAEKLSQWTYSSGDKPVKILNDDRPSTIKASDFKSEHIDYGGLDKLNRTKTATAYLTRNNLGRSNTRTEQTWRPTGWNNQPKYVKGQRIIPQNRGHLIAYTMTFNLNKSGQVQQGQLGSIDNPYNLFTQTSFSNQKTMVQIEQTVRNSLAKNKKVIYQVTPVFRGNELMARGVWVQALATDGSMKLNRYLWNVENHLQFDYTTGRSKVDLEFQVPEVQNPYQQRHYHKKSYHRNY